jgi:hypothetical protein
MRNSMFYCIGAWLLISRTAAHATTFTFHTDPFEGTNIRIQPGRQLVGGEDFVAFSIATDVFSLNASAFGVSAPVRFVNDLAENLPTGGVNLIVLRGFDNDANPGAPFGAGNAADLIADHITTVGPGFFVYFDQPLDLPRFVYSTDLSSRDEDLKILARMLNLRGETGREAMQTFTAGNSEITTTAPEPSGFVSNDCTLASMFS